MNTDNTIDTFADLGSKKFMNYNKKTQEVYRNFEMVDLKSCLKSVRFYQYFGMLFLASQFGSYFTYSYKSIGLTVNISDRVLSLASSVSGFLQLVTRIALGSLYDKVGFKKIFYGIMIVNTLNGILAYKYRHNEVFFVICIELTYMVFSGLYSTLPSAIYKTFGPKYGPGAYALILAGGTMTALTSYIYQHFLYDLIGSQNILYIGSVSSVAAMTICFFFSEMLDFTRMEK